MNEEKTTREGGGKSFPSPSPSGSEGEHPRGSSYLPCLMSDEDSHLHSSPIFRPQLSSMEKERFSASAAITAPQRGKPGVEGSSDDDTHVGKEEEDEKENTIPFSFNIRSSSFDKRREDTLAGGDKTLAHTPSDSGLVKEENKPASDHAGQGQGQLRYESGREAPGFLVDQVYGPSRTESVRCVPGDRSEGHGSRCPLKATSPRVNENACVALASEAIPGLSSENKAPDEHTPQTSLEVCEVITVQSSPREDDQDVNVTAEGGAHTVPPDRPDTPGVHTPQPSVPSGGTCDVEMLSDHPSSSNVSPGEATVRHSRSQDDHDVCMASEVSSDSPDMPRAHTPETGVRTPQPRVHTPEPSVHTPEPGVRRAQPGERTDGSCDDVAMASASPLVAIPHEETNLHSTEADPNPERGRVGAGKEETVRESSATEESILIETHSEKEGSSSPPDRNGDVTNKRGRGPAATVSSCYSDSNASSSTTRRTSGRIASISNKGGSHGTSSSGPAGTMRTPGGAGGGGGGGGSSRSGTSGTAVQLSPEQEKVRQLYSPLLQETEQELRQTLSQGLPEVDTLSNPQVYLELRQHILSGPSSPSAVDGDEDDKTDSEDSSLNLLKRLLRALCEGSTLPLSSLVEEVQRVLREGDGSRGGDASPCFQDVCADTLRNLIPVLLSRRSLGIPRRVALAGGGGAAGLKTLSSPPSSSSSSSSSSDVTIPSGGSATPDLVKPEASSSSFASSSSSSSTGPATGGGASGTTVAGSAAEPFASVSSSSSSFSPSLSRSIPDKNEDVTPECLWVWESAFLEGLPPFFKEKARKLRDKRTSVSRKLKSLLRLRQCIEQGVEKEILTAKEKVEALRRRERQEEERRKEQELKRRRAEEAKLEREREKKQKEDARKEREKEREKKKQVEEQCKQTSSPSPSNAKTSQKGESTASWTSTTSGGGGASGTSASSNSSGPSRKAASQKDLHSMKGQQSFMVSWLARKPGMGGCLTSGVHGDSSSFFGKSCVMKRGGAPLSSRSGGGPEDEEGRRGRGEGGVGQAKDSQEDAGRGAKDTTESEKEKEEEEEGEEEREARLRQEEERKARALASYEASVWRVPYDKKVEFIEKAIHLPRPLSPIPIDACTSIPFFDDGPDHEEEEKKKKDSADDSEEPRTASATSSSTRKSEEEEKDGSFFFLNDFIENYATPHMESWRNFYSFYARNRHYVHKLPASHQGNAAAMMTSHAHDGSHGGAGAGSTHSSSSSSSSLSAGSGGGGGGGEGFSSSSFSSSCCYRLYKQDMREVRQGLILTDYAGGASLRDLPYLRTAWVNLDDWKRPVRRLLLGKQATKSSACEQWEEESCIDYDRDSDEEWFENFDVDDLDDGRGEEEEEEELEGDEDKDWLVEDDEEGIKNSAGYFSVRFESLYDWRWSFEGEDKPNANEVRDIYTVLTSRDRNWSSIYGCIADDFGGKPFEKIEAVGCLPNSRKRLTEEELCSLLKLCHGRNIPKSKLLADFHKLNRHLTKADLERKFKEHIVYERRPEDKQKRWYVSPEATEAFNLRAELESILQAIRAEESNSNNCTSSGVSGATNSPSTSVGNSGSSVNTATSNSSGGQAPQGVTIKTPQEQGGRGAVTTAAVEGGAPRGGERDGETSLSSPSPPTGGGECWKAAEGLNKESHHGSSVKTFISTTSNGRSMLGVSGGSPPSSESVASVSSSSSLASSSVLAQLLRSTQACASRRTDGPAESKNSATGSRTISTVSRKEEGGGQEEEKEEADKRSPYSDNRHHGGSVLFSGIDCVSSAAWVAASSAKAALDIVIKTEEAEEQDQGRSDCSSSIYHYGRDSSSLKTPTSSSSSSSSMAFHLAAAAMAASELAKEVAGSLMEEQQCDADNGLQEETHSGKRQITGTEGGGGADHSHDGSCCKSSRGAPCYPSVAGSSMRTQNEQLLVKARAGERELWSSHERAEMNPTKETKGENGIVETSEDVAASKESEGVSSAVGTTPTEVDTKENRSYVSAVTPPKPAILQRQKDDDDVVGQAQKSAVETSPVPVGKRRRSDGDEEEEEDEGSNGSRNTSTTSSSIASRSSGGATTKKAKRGSVGQSCSSGQTFSATKGSALKNTLITQYFRCVPPQSATRRASEGKGGRDHTANSPSPR